jgi:plasmid stabilization system protein ParE
MVREVIWNDQALADVESIKDHIARGSVGQRLLRNILRSFEESPQEEYIYA